MSQTELPLFAEGDYSPITYCRRCGAAVPEREAFRSNTADFCTLACKSAHQEQGDG